MNQTGCYAKFFLAHEHKFGKQRVQTWRAALTQIAGFSGWDVPNYRSESKLVRIIAEKLSHNLKCSLQNSSSNQLVPSSSKVKPIEFYSYEGLGDIGIVRICSMDGMRRTTMARVVYDAVVNEKWGNDRFQELVCEMPKECSRYVWDIDTVINAIQKKMALKKVLLLVDHVDTLEQVASMVRKHAHRWVVPKSRIIVSASTPNKPILNALDINFHVPETTENNLFLDIACFVAEMDDSHVTRIIRSLVSTNLCTNSGMEVLINKTLINISDYDKPLNIEEPTSLDMLLDMCSTRDNNRLSESNSKPKNRSTYGSVDKKSGKRQIPKHNLVKSFVTVSQKEAPGVSLPVRNRGKSEAHSEIGTHKSQLVHKFVEDARNSAASNASGDVATESQGVNIEQNLILDMANLCTSRKINETELPNSLTGIRDDCMYECDTISPRISVCSPGSDMLFSSKTNHKKLQYFMPEIVNGKKIVRIPQAVLAEGIKQWELCLVGQLLGKCSEISQVLNEANELWGKEGSIQVTKTKNGLYIFKFPNENIRDSVLESGPSYIANKPLVLRMWQSDMQLSELDNSKIPVWVKLFGIPIEYVTRKGVSYIASALGKPLYTANADTCCLDFVKVCVEVNMEDDFMDFIAVTGWDGDELRVQVEYLWKPEKCITCKEFGHSFSECPNLCCTNTPF
ncbi:Disease resistance protein (TIR-NBS class) [Euphorbia peplus]|nr:Disease resistance protein (TIR-NBS class) [Euphorbia peplus]